MANHRTTVRNGYRTPAALRLAAVKDERGSARRIFTSGRLDSGSAATTRQTLLRKLCLGFRRSSCMRRRMTTHSAFVRCVVLGAVTAVAWAAPADAQELPAAEDPVATPPTPEIQPVKAPSRAVSLEPKIAEAPAAGRATFDVDPIADTSLIVVSFGFGTVLEWINSTGEIRPQQIAPDFDRSNLLAIDRVALTSTPSAQAGTFSNWGMGATMAFAVIDPVLSGFRERSLQTGLVDAMLYAESASLTLALTDMVKLAVRRPRPRAYLDAEANRDDPAYANRSTDSALSFFSGHASMTATLGATATYLAFTRSPNTARPWITLLLATGLTTFVSIERVRAGKHFPTDVIAGSVAGAGIGVLVPHLHRTEDVKQRRVWVGFAPVDTREGASGGTMSVSGVF
jgi:membrane-associated phospholipid phosphatase